MLQYCDFEDFVRHLDIDPGLDANDLVMVAAHHMFSAALPPHWSEQIDESSSRVYFYNRASGESLWLHPQEALFKELIAEVRAWGPEQPLEAACSRSQAHLQQAHARAVETIGQWCAYSAPPQGPEEAPEIGRASQFYYNSTTGESCWVNPREGVEFDLRQRHSILCECVAAHAQSLLRTASSDSSEGEDPRLSSGGAQALVRSLWESLAPLPLPLPARPADLPPVSSSPGRRPLSGGEDAMQSSRSFISARSNMSCGEEARDATPRIDPEMQREPQ